MNHPFQNVIGPLCIVCDSNNPTFKYWLDGYIEKNKLNITFISPKQNINYCNLSLFNTFIFVRIIPQNWIKFLKISSKKKILVLDDDLLSIQSLKDLPLRYSLKLFWNITRYSYNLDNYISEIWVTSKNLKNKYNSFLIKQKLNIKIIPLLPSKNIIKNKKLNRISYLGTSSHKKELFWVKTLFEKLQEQRDDCLVEIVANRYWRNKFRHIPQCRIFYPMDFDSFLKDTSNRKIDLLLVPLLFSKFNNCRSPVKFFDAARLNAVGLYSNREPYSNFVYNNKDGLLIDDEQNLWLDNIHNLLDDKSKLRKLKSSCKKRVKEFL